jgi:hypothetical protein
MTHEGGILMGRFKHMVTAAGAAVVLSAAFATAQGVLPDRATNVTISAPVSVPGMVLPAGEYLFRLADTQASRNVVQIYAKDRSKLYTTLIAVSAQRDEPSDEAVVTFRETPADQPPALRYWYYAGEKIGQEFAYPKDQAIQIARASNQPVMAIDSTASDVESMQKAELHRLDPTSPEVANEQQAAAQSQPVTPADPQAPAPKPAEPQAPTPAEPATPTPAEPAAPTPAEPAAPTTPAPTPAEPQTPTPAQPQAARPSEPQPTATAGRDVVSAPAGTSGRSEAATAPADSGRELPRTAGELPLVALMGFIALGAAAGARALRRRMML